MLIIAVDFFFERKVKRNVELLKILPGSSRIAKTDLLRSNKADIRQKKIKEPMFYRMYM